MDYYMVNVSKIFPTFSVLSNLFSINLLKYFHFKGTRNGEAETSVPSGTLGKQGCR